MTDPTTPDAGTPTDAVVVLGTGPAGIAVAEGLLKRGRSVVLVDGGAARERDTDRELNAGDEARGVWGHEPLHENRRRVLGGTSTAWGGRCIPLDPVDFEQRDWIPDSGWPIPYAEFARWLPEAARLLEIPDTPFRRSSPDPIFATGEEIDGAPIELWSPPTDVSRLLAHLQSTEPRLTVLTDHHVTGLVLDADQRLVALRAVTERGEVLLRGERFVLAAGALENARLLLTSALAQRLPALGRYYMSHVFATYVAYSGKPLPRATGFFRIGRTYARHRWQLTAAAQRAARVGNVIGFIARPPVQRMSVHLDPLSATIAAVKLVRRHLRSPQELWRQRRQLAVYGRVIAAAPPSFWPHVVAQSLQRGRRNRLPMLLPPREARTHHLTVQAEHLPHRDSRVALSDRVDRYGVPLLVPEIDFHRADFESVEVFHQAMERFLGGLGYRPDQDPATATRSLARDMFGGFNSNAHHIGTTRMGADPATSVVDADCRVHGVQNLFVAGASVFPTSGHANPTLSIVALACRLADRLGSA
ncbi:GMC family oxidoreductase [Amnibacterium soli]|uniref:GMC family oxidoreductase n=1 Tax=Amnibacterium soli TaxID=1282736 RepID=A0ABP8ZDJ9_9MICO